MLRAKEVGTCLVLLSTLITLTTSIPIIEHGEYDAPQQSESREAMMLRYRLPINTVPRLYKISLEPNMENEHFTWIGETSIDIEVLEATSLLTLHAHKNLAIDENSTELVCADGSKLKPVAQIRDNEVQFLKVEFDHEIPAGNYSLDFKYTGVELGETNGFYKYSNVAATHFEATTARSAFPCWDEPSIKARFNVSIKHFPNYTALSNMPEIDRAETTNGKVLTTFDTTPLMSTYLVTFVIADYGNFSNENGNVTIWAPRENLDEVKHVVEFSPKVIEVMEKYTGFSYGFPRVGSVSLSVYGPAATEHWGLIAYNEHIVKFNQSHEPYTRRDGAQLLIAHELTHSWFGNRVSPAWWNDLWLNEAFAAYLQYYIMDMVFDNWGGMGRFISVNNWIITFPYDDEHALPTRWTPVTNIEIRRMFGPMTYRKGAAIVHMFRNVLTDDVFQAGIQKYLGKHSFGAAAAEDLIEAFQEAYDEGVNAKTPLNVNETMTSWLVQSGYPTINVTRNYTTGATTVTQKCRFSSNNCTNRWWVPLTYLTASNFNYSSTAPSKWISDQEDSVTIDGIAKDDWVIFNIQSSGYYKVNYDEENLNRIADYLNTENYKNIPVINRAQLIKDCEKDNQDLEEYFKNFYRITKYLHREVEYLPWEAALDNLRVIDRALSGSEMHITFQKYFFGMMNKLIEKVGFEERATDDHLTIMSRVNLLGWACFSGHSGCSEYAAEKVVKIVENQPNHRFHVDTEHPIFCAGLRGLNDTRAKQVFAWVVEHGGPPVIESIGCTENHEIQRDFLMSIIAKNTSRAAAYELIKSFEYIAVGSDENFNFAVDFVIQNHQAIGNYLQSSSDLQQVLQIIALKVATPARLEKFRKILQLDAIATDKDIDKEMLLSNAEYGSSMNDKFVAIFRNFFDVQLTADNTIINSHPESR